MKITNDAQAQIVLSEDELTVLRYSKLLASRADQAIAKLKSNNLIERHTTGSRFACDATDAGRAYLAAIEKREQSNRRELLWEVHRKHPQAENAPDSFRGAFDELIYARCFAKSLDGTFEIRLAPRSEDSLKVGDPVTRISPCRGTIKNIREQRIALVKWFGVESESEVPLSELTKVKR